MFKPVLYVAGSIHQGDEMFSDISRRRQGEGNVHL
jgi:hypothetical protein